MCVCVCACIVCIYVIKRDERAGHRGHIPVPVVDSALELRANQVFMPLGPPLCDERITQILEERQGKMQGFFSVSHQSLCNRLIQGLFDCLRQGFSELQPTSKIQTKTCLFSPQVRSRPRPVFSAPELSMDFLHLYKVKKKKKETNMRQILYGMQILKYFLSGLKRYLYLYVYRYLYLSVYVNIRHFTENVCQSLFWENELFLIYYLLLIRIQTQCGFMITWISCQ